MDGMLLNCFRCFCVVRQMVVLSQQHLCINAEENENENEIKEWNNIKD